MNNENVYSFILSETYMTWDIHDFVATAFE